RCSAREAPGMRARAAPRLRRSSVADGSLRCPQCVAFHGRTAKRKHIGPSLVNEPGHGPAGCPPCGGTRTWPDPRLLPIPQGSQPLSGSFGVEKRLPGFLHRRRWRGVAAHRRGRGHHHAPRAVEARERRGGRRHESVLEEAIHSAAARRRKKTLKAATQTRRGVLTRDRRKLSRGALRGVTLAFGLLLAQSTQAERTFTTASLQGTYSYVNHNDDVASFGLIIFDGLGKLTVTIKVNAGTPETRKITTLTGTGTCNVDAAGTG